MTIFTPDRFVFAPHDLLPAEWLRMQPPEKFHIYNPAIVRFRDRLIMAYRVDSGRRATMQRRIGLCALDDRLNVVLGSVVPLSNTIQGGDPRHYDPRFLVYGDRLFVHYNNNFLTRPNQISLVELDPNTLEARSSARSPYLDGPRHETLLLSAPRSGLRAPLNAVPRLDFSWLVDDNAAKDAASLTRAHFWLDEMAVVGHTGYYVESQQMVADLQGIAAPVAQAHANANPPCIGLAIRYRDQPTPAEVEPLEE
jgi:hypothetical protein